MSTRILKPVKLLAVFCNTHCLQKKKKTVCCQVWPTDICGCSPNVIGTFICMNIWCALESALSLQTIRMGRENLHQVLQLCLEFILCFKYSHIMVDRYPTW